MEFKVVTGGVYQESVKGKVGTGDTSRDSVLTSLWLATPLDGSAVQMELLDIDEQPSGYKEVVDQEEFGKRFVHLPDHQPNTTTPKQRQAEQRAARGERHLAQKEFHSAEYEFSRALQMEEENVRAAFGLGQTYMAQGEEGKARDVFRKLSHNDQVTEPRHKHIFNDFGIQLRKLGMHAEAVRHYHRALALEQNDENLWFNLGRALAEGGQRAQAVRALKRAMGINPELIEARRYLTEVLKEKI